MADPVKPLDRNRPFTRINNDAFLVKKRPDGVGVTCGCHTAKDFPDNLISNLLQLAVDDQGFLGDLLKVLKTVHDASQIAKDVATGLLLILVLFTSGFGIVPIVLLAGQIESFLDTVTEIIEAALKSFLSQFLKRILTRGFHVIPQWVPVKQGARNDIVTADQIVEVEGLAVRSYGNPIEVPLSQWHRWFNWSVQVRPEEPYKNLTSPSPLPSDITGMTTSEKPVAEAGSFEIQWDTGALWAPGGADATALENGFPENAIDRHDGPMMVNDWAWPVAGMHVWASGRWVYDCSQTSPEANPRMCSLINPCKAIATARWQAVKFPENEAFVPAIQFMFFASTRGGYINYAAIDDTDYEFIVDLPPLEDQHTAPFPIGHTPKFPHNTILLRPRLLKLCNTGAFRIAGGAQANPIIEPIQPDDPTQAPKQVRITVPKTLIKGANAYGVIVSLGWFDPNLLQAKKVKHCKMSVQQFSGRKEVRDSGIRSVIGRFKQEQEVLKKTITDAIESIPIIKIPGIPGGLTLKDLPSIPGTGIGPREAIEKVFGIIFDAFLGELAKIFPENEEWLLRVGVNGAWKSRFFPSVGSAALQFQPQLDYDLFLGPDDTLFLSVHGMEFNPVGDMMRTGHANRRLVVDGVEVPWPLIVTPSPDPKVALDKWRDIARAYLRKLTPTLGMENQPLGIIDPGETGTSLNSANPLLVKNAKGQAKVEHTAKFARALDNTSILVEAISKDDYTITSSLTIEDQALT